MKRLLATTVCFSTLMMYASIGAAVPQWINATITWDDISPRAMPNFTEDYNYNTWGIQRRSCDHGTHCQMIDIFDFNKTSGTYCNTNYNIRAMSVFVRDTRTDRGTTYTADLNREWRLTGYSGSHPYYRTSREYAHPNGLDDVAVRWHYKYLSSAREVVYIGFHKVVPSC